MEGTGGRKVFNSCSIKEDRHTPSEWDAAELSETLQEVKALLLDLTTQFICGHSREIAKIIDNGLKDIGTLLKFNRLILYEFYEDARETRNVYAFSVAGISETESPYTELNPELLSASKSTFPLKVNDRLRGVLLADPFPGQSWPEELTEQLHRLGQILAGVLERKGADEQIHQIEQFERLLSEISATYINLPARQLEGVLRDDFARLSQTLGVDACMLFLAEETKEDYVSVKPFVWYIDEKRESNRLLIEWLKQNPRFDSAHAHYTFSQYKKGECVKWSYDKEIPNDAAHEKRAESSLGVKSTLAVPISFAGAIAGVLNVVTTEAHRLWPKDLSHRLRLFGEVFINALMRKQSEERLRNAFAEIGRLKERFEADYLYLKEQIDVGYNFNGVVGKSSAIQKVLMKAKQVASTNTSVLILGETGTGKGLIARAIHNASVYKNRPLVQVNCAAFAPNLVESELFGHEKGSFTGAAARRIGRFEAAKGTTLFLDEIGELPYELQAKLLRVLEEGEFERVGGNKTIRAEVRLIVATSRNLQKEVEAGKFRRDLWYRLNVFPIIVPPLRDRLEDIPLFVAYYVEKYSKWAGKRFDSIPVQIIKALQAYSWPGNIRELKNLIERTVITSLDRNLRVELPNQPDGTPEKLRTLREIERESILSALNKTHWKINGIDGAAQYLDIHPETLRARMRKLNIKRPQPPFQA
jgi:formate hydrogenlyase transcriptional activator